MNTHHHLVNCRDGCLLDNLVFCKAVPEGWAAQYQARAKECPDLHQSYTSDVIYERITGKNR